VQTRDLGGRARPTMPMCERPYPAPAASRQGDCCDSDRRLGAATTNRALFGSGSYYIGVDGASALVHNNFCSNPAHRGEHIRRRANQRGFSDDMIEQALRNPGRRQKNGRYKHFGRKIWMVREKDGCLVSCGWR
jgi:hypothetical protein